VLAEIQKANQVQMTSIETLEPTTFMEPRSKPPRDGFKVQVLLGTLSLSSHHVNNTLNLFQEETR